MLPRHLAELETRLARRVDEALAEYRQTIERRLRDAVEQLATTAAELPSPAMPRLLEGLELGTLDLGSRRDAVREALSELVAGARELDGARTQAEALEALLDRATAWADRVALLLVRDPELTSWAERGFGARGFDDAALAEHAETRDRLLARRGCLALDADEAKAVTATIGIDDGGAAVVVPLVLRDRIAALLWADRRESAPELAALQLLVAAAAQRLELQALSDREQTPTLWEESEAPGAPLELWGTPAEVAAAAEPDQPATAEAEAAEAPEPAEPAAAEPPPLEEAPLRAAEATVESVVAAEPDAAAEPEPAVWPPAAEVADEPQTVLEPPPAAEAAPSGAPSEGDEEAEDAEPLPEFEYASEPEPPLAQEPAPTLEPPVDALGTVRMVRPPEPAAPERPVEETTRPFEVQPAPAEIAATHEIEPPIAPPPETTASVDVDLTEDATLLTAPRPDRLPAAAAPAPPPISEPPAPMPAMPPVPPVPPAREEDPHDRTWGRGGRSTQVMPPADLEGPGLAFIAGRASRALSESPAHEEAKRLARLLISEIKLYNEEQVLEGRRNRDLYHRLREDIDRSRQIFDERVDAAVRGEVDYFQQELVRSLAGGNPRALGI